MVTLVFLSLVALLTTILVSLIKKRHAFWKDRGAPYIEPRGIMGSISGFGKTLHIGVIMQNFFLKYRNAKEPFIGGFLITQPVAIITDLDLAKNILIKDFHNFPDRAAYCNERDDPLSCHIFNMGGHKWKIKRRQLTTTFTTGKMRSMAPLLFSVTKNLESAMLKLIERTDGVCDLQVKDILGRFTTDVIESCVFGFESNSLGNQYSYFQSYAMNIFEKPGHGPLVRLLLAIYSDIGRSLRIRNERKETSSLFLKTVKQIVDYREKNNYHRNDFMDLLIDLKNGKSSNLAPLSLEEITAPYIFFGAGFETSSSTMACVLYELALNQEIQEEARRRINEVLEKHHGVICYDTIKDMTYLDKIIQESLRKYPIIPHLNRKTLNDYQVPNSPHIIPKGAFINIPILGYHNDPDIWPDPEKFDPSRFDVGNIRNRHPASYLPFGTGPRSCIGMRFAKFQVTAGLVVLLRSFKFVPCSRTRIPLRFRPSPITLNAEGGIWLCVEKI